MTTQLAQFDDIDQAILDRRRRAWDAKPGPRVGDFVQMKPDADLRRFAHDWGDALQVTPAEWSGSFYLPACGVASYSGGLNPSIPAADLAWHGEYRPDGLFWFFHHDRPRAGGAVYFRMRCRLYHYNPRAAWAA